MKATIESIQDSLDDALELVSAEHPDIEIVLVAVQRCPGDPQGDDICSRTNMLPAVAADMLEHAARDYRSDKVKRVR